MNGNGLISPIIQVINFFSNTSSGTQSFGRPADSNSQASQDFQNLWAGTQSTPIGAHGTSMHPTPNTRHNTTFQPVNSRPQGLNSSGDENQLIIGVDDNTACTARNSGNGTRLGTKIAGILFSSSGSRGSKNPHDFCPPPRTQVIVGPGAAYNELGVQRWGARHRQPHAAPPTPHAPFPGHQAPFQVTTASASFRNSTTNHHPDGVEIHHLQLSTDNFTNGSSMSRPPPNQHPNPHHGTDAERAQQTMQQFMSAINGWTPGTPFAMNFAQPNAPFPFTGAPFGTPNNYFLGQLQGFGQLPQMAGLPHVAAMMQNTNPLAVPPSGLQSVQAYSPEVHAQIRREYDQALRKWRWPDGTRLAQLRHDRTQQPNWDQAEGMWVPSMPGARAEGFFSQDEIEIMKQNALCYKGSRYYFGMEYRTDDYGLFKYVKRKPGDERKKLVRFGSPGEVFVCQWDDSAVNMSADPKHPGPGEPRWGVERPNLLGYDSTAATDLPELGHNRITELEPSERGSVIEEEHSATGRTPSERVRESAEESERFPRWDKNFEPNYLCPETEGCKPRGNLKILYMEAIAFLELRYNGVTDEDIMKETGINRDHLMHMYRVLGIMCSSWNMKQLQNSKRPKAEVQKTALNWANNDYVRFKWLQNEGLKGLDTEEQVMDKYYKLFSPLGGRIVNGSNQEETSRKDNTKPDVSAQDNTHQDSQQASSAAAVSQQPAQGDPEPQQTEQPKRAAPAPLVLNGPKDKGPAQPSGQSPPDSQASSSDPTPTGDPTGINRKRHAEATTVSQEKRPRHRFGTQRQFSVVIDVSESSDDDEDTEMEGPVMSTLSRTSTGTIKQADRAVAVARSKLTKGSPLEQSLKQQEEKIAEMKKMIAEKQAAKMRGVTSAAVTPAVTPPPSSGSYFPPPAAASGQLKEKAGTVPLQTKAAEKDGAMNTTKAQASAASNGAETRKPSDDKTADIETLRKALKKQIAAKKEIEGVMNDAQTNPSENEKNAQEKQKDFRVEPQESQSKEKTPEQREKDIEQTAHMGQEDDEQVTMQAELEEIRKQEAEMVKRKRELMERMSKTPVPGRAPSLGPVRGVEEPKEQPTTAVPAPPAEAPAEDTVVTDAGLASSSSLSSSSSSESSDSSSDSSSESESEEEPVLRMDEDVELNVPTNVNPAAPGPVTLVKNEQPEAQTKAAQAKSTDGGFVPYHSPFEFFSSFRHFASFKETNPNLTLRSLVFSTKLDPMNPLCRFEFSGGVCNDNTCSWQHVRNIEMTDQEVCNALIVPPFWVTNIEDRDKYTTEVAKILVKCKERGLTSSDIIGRVLVEYRRQFISKIEDARMNASG